MLERHFTVKELSKEWHLSFTTVTGLFMYEEGVVRLCSNEGTARQKRAKVSLRIPQSVAERVYRRLTETGWPKPPKPRKKRLPEGEPQ